MRKHLPTPTIVYSCFLQSSNFIDYSYNMGLLFSSDKKNAKKNLKDDEIITAKDRAILDLKNARDKLKKFRKKVRIFFQYL